MEVGKDLGQLLSDSSVQHDLKAAEPWLVWLSGFSARLWTEGLPVQFQVRAHAWVAGQAPNWGCAGGN